MTTVFWSGDGHCYWLRDTAVDWNTARDRCAEEGGVLATYAHTADANVVLAAFPNKTTWLGLSREIRSRSYLWTTGEPVTDANQLFLTRVIASSAPSLDCLRQEPGWSKDSQALQGSWIPTSCDSPLPFVCEQVDWFIDGRTHHAYRVLYDRKGWDDARQSCGRLGGHLATITSAEELDFVGGHVAVEAWIGATDAEQELTFVWVTGERFEFQAFVPGELDDPTTARRHDCVVLGTDRLWHDRRCDKAHHYLCEVE